MESHHRPLGFNQLLCYLSYRSVVERVGVEPTKPLGRLVYSQGISPVKASPVVENWNFANGKSALFRIWS